MAHVAEWKHKEVEGLRDLIKEYPVVGIANMENLPTKQLQKMRAQFRGEVLLKMSRKSLMKLSLEGASKDRKAAKKLMEHLGGQPAFIFSKMDSFKLYKLLKRNRTSAPAKPNAVAPKDIVVPKGETQFPPGPVLAELQQIGIPTAIAGGKISIKEDKVVARKGEKISPNVATVLSRLEIEPMEIGLQLLATCEEGAIYTPEILDVDVDKTRADLQAAYANAFNLSLNSGYLTKQTAEAGIAKAVSDARNLAINATIFASDVITDIITKASRQAVSLETALGDSVERKMEELGKAPAGEEKKAEAKEEPKPEEAKPEEKPAEEAPKEKEVEKKETKPKKKEKPKTEKAAKPPAKKAAKGGKKKK